MTVVAVGSAGASPGVSALAVGLGQARARRGGRIVLVEADPAGGRLASRFGLPPEPSLLSFVADARRGPSAEVLFASTKLVGRLPVVTCPADPRLARHALVEGGGTLADCLRTHRVDGVLDLGRIDDESPALALAARADVVLLLTRPRTDEVQALVFRRDLLREVGCEPQLVTVGDQPHSPAEVAEVVGIPLLATWPDDPVASALCGGRFTSKHLARSRLWRTTLALADRLFDATPAAPGP